MTPPFTEDYIEQCFHVWFTLGQPKNMDTLWDAIPTPIEADKPSRAFLRSCVDNYGWVERADALNALAVQKAEPMLVDTRAQMFKRQAEQALQIANLAREHLLENGFDTSASAVNALFRATEEERTARGVSDMLVKISKMSPEELEARAIKLLRRQNESVDAVIVEDNASSSNQTT